MLSVSPLTKLSPAQRFERLADALPVTNPRFRRVALTRGNELFFAYGEGLDGNWHGIAGFVYETPFAQTFDYLNTMSEKELHQTIIKYAEETVLAAMVKDERVIH